MIDLVTLENTLDLEGTAKHLCEIRDRGFDSLYLARFPRDIDDFLQEQALVAFKDDLPVGYFTYISPQNPLYTPSVIVLYHAINNSGKNQTDVRFDIHNDVFLKELTVLPEYRGEKIGRMLTDGVMDLLTGSGKFFLCARTGGKYDSSHFFSHIGFSSIMPFGEEFADGTRYTIMYKPAGQ